MELRSKQAIADTVHCHPRMSAKQIGRIRHLCGGLLSGIHLKWIPAFAGMTTLFVALLFTMTCGSAAANEIRGRILLEPPLPAVQKVKMDQKRQDKCDPERYPVGLVFSPEGGVQNAVVSLKGHWPVSQENFGPAVLDQRNCVFEPHVLLVKPGVPFKITTSDSMDHEVRSFDGTTMLFHFAMDPHGHFVEKTFDKPGTYLMRCGLHSWMHAFVVAAENPFYAVSSSDGKFALRNVPPGKHILKVWHETLGEMELPVEASKEIEEIRYVFPAIKN